MTSLNFMLENRLPDILADIILNLLLESLSLISLIINACQKMALEIRIAKITKKVIDIIFDFLLLENINIILFINYFNNGVFQKQKSVQN